jgi:hypothetical protein
MRSQLASFIFNIVDLSIKILISDLFIVA